MIFSRHVSVGLKTLSLATAIWIVGISSPAYAQSEWSKQLREALSSGFDFAAIEKAALNLPETCASANEESDYGTMVSIFADECDEFAQAVPEGVSLSGIIYMHNTEFNDVGITLYYNESFEDLRQKLVDQGNVAVKLQRRSDGARRYIMKAPDGAEFKVTPDGFVRARVRYFEKLGPAQ